MRCHALTLALLLPLACAGDDEATAGDSTSSTSTNSTTGEDSTSTTADTDTTGEESTSSGATSDASTSSSATTDDPTTSTTSGEPVCGDGIDGPGEYCDEGGVNTEDCDEDCTIPKCGDGLLNEAAGEECDDNNYVSDDGCSKECVVEYCGDGIVQEGLGEECDDGNDVDFDGCSAECLVDKPCGEGFTTTWCQQAGLELDQYTRCESVSDDQATCVNPEIRYGTNEGGIPIWYGDDPYTEESISEWCVTLGFSGVDTYDLGSRDCAYPRGPVFWSIEGDEVTPHWRDRYGDAKWYPPSELNDQMKDCEPGKAITSVSCVDK